MSAPESTRLLLIRHGESRATTERFIGGPRSCRGLTERGHEQGRLLASRLSETRELEVDVLYTSGYPRAIETAEYLSVALGVDPLVDAALGEHDPGPECDGLGYDEYVRRYGTPDWQADPHAVVFPGGETLAEFHARVHLGLDALLTRHRGSTVMAVCHAGVIDAVLRRSLGTAQVGVFEMYTLNTSITELQQLESGRWRLLRYNDAAHLIAAAPGEPRVGSGP